jgi:hypothetical protein
VRLLNKMNNKLWRRLPASKRRKLMGFLEHFLPRALFQRILAAAGSGIYRQEVLSTGILFIHIPKAAGTAVTRSLYGLGGVGHYRAIDAQAQNPELYRFAVTRNPWERLLSSYKFAKTGGTKEVPLNNSRNLVLQLPNTFDEFVLDWLIHQQPEELHSIFMPQYLFVSDSTGSLMVDDIFEMKNMSPLETELSKRVGREVNISRANATGSENSMLSAYSNIKVVEAVGRFYQRDIEMFGYEYPLKMEATHSSRTKIGG